MRAALFVVRVADWDVMRTDASDFGKPGRFTAVMDPRAFVMVLRDVPVAVIGNVSAVEVNRLLLFVDGALVGLIIILSSHISSFPLSFTQPPLFAM